MRRRGGNSIAWQLSYSGLEGAVQQSHSLGTQTPAVRDDQRTSGRAERSAHS